MSLQTEVRERVLIITIDNPDRMNALSPTALSDLVDAWVRARDDEEITVVIFTAVGDRAFCTGMDLSGAGDLGESSQEAVPVGPLENQMWKPVIVAVNGVCAGAGLHFVAEGDIVIAASHATFVDTHVSVGQVAGFEPVLLSHRMPFGAVARMTLLGRAERLTADRALALGLVTEVVEGAELMARAWSFAEALKANSPAAMIGSKKALWNSLELPLSEAMRQAWILVTDHWKHPDSQEGPAAFMEKRPPKWT